jgi:hypothetical protein
MDIVVQLVIGLCCGFLVATIGALKDKRWEPFRWRTFFRSPTLTFGWVAILTVVPEGFRWLFLPIAAISMERISVEAWKGLLGRMPSKFRSPSRDRGWIVDEVASHALRNGHDGHNGGAKWIGPDTLNGHGRPAAASPNGAIGEAVILTLKRRIAHLELENERLRQRRSARVSGRV